MKRAKIDMSQVAWSYIAKDLALAYAPSHSSRHLIEMIRSMLDGDTEQGNVEVSDGDS